MHDGQAGLRSGMQCVRCGKVLNQEEQRCPKCHASLTNQQIGQIEVARQQLGEIADIERAGMTTRHARQGASNGVILGTLGMLLSCNLVLIIAGALVGCGVGWFISWRRWGQFRTSLLFSVIMLPLVAVVGFNPFIVLETICTGMVLGLAIQLNQDG